VKGVHFLGSAGCGKMRESWRIGTVVGVGPGFWHCCVWRVDSQRARSPCGIIVSARGWFVIERK